MRIMRTPYVTCDSIDSEGIETMEAVEIDRHERNGRHRGIAGFLTAMEANLGRTLACKKQDVTPFFQEMKIADHWIPLLPTQYEMWGSCSLRSKYPHTPRLDGQSPILTSEGSGIDFECPFNPTSQDPSPREGTCRYDSITFFNEQNKPLTLYS